MSRTDLNRDLVVIGENEGAGADPQVSTMNGIDYLNTVEVIALAGGAYSVQRHLTRGSCGPTVEEMTEADMLVYLKKARNAATRAGQKFTIKGFNAQNQFDELEALARVSAQVNAQFETAICYSKANTDEYMKAKITEAVNFAYENNATNVSIKSMIGDLTGEKAKLYAEYLNAAIKEVYAVEIVEALALDYKPNQLVEATDVTRDRYQSIAGNQLNPADPLILSSVKIKGELVKEQVLNESKTPQFTTHKGKVIPKAGLHSHNPTGLACEANDAFADVFIADTNGIVIPVVDLMHKVAPGKDVTWQNFDSLPDFITRFESRHGSSVSAATQQKINEANAYLQMCDEGNKAAFIADDPDFLIPNEVAAIIGIPGGGKSHTIKAFKALAKELGISNDTMVAQYLRSYALIRGVNIEEVYAVEIANPETAAKFEEITKLMRPINLSVLEELAPNGVFPGLSTVTPDHSNADHVAGVIAKNLKQNKTGLDLLRKDTDTLTSHPGIKPGALNLMRKNDFPGGEMSPEVFEVICQEWLASQLATGTALNKSLADAKPHDVELDEIISSLVANAANKAAIASYLTDLGYEQGVIDQVSSEADERGYLLTTRAKPKYEARRQELQEHRDGASPIQALIVDPVTAMRNKANTPLTGPFGLTKEQWAAKRSAELSSRSSRTHSSDPYGINVAELTRYNIAGAHIDPDEITAEEKHAEALLVAPGLVSCPIEYSQFVIDYIAQNPKVAQVVDPVFVSSGIAASTAQKRNARGFCSSAREVSDVSGSAVDAPLDALEAIQKMLDNTEKKGLGVKLFNSTNIPHLPISDLATLVTSNSFGGNLPPRLPAGDNRFSAAARNIPPIPSFTHGNKAAPQNPSWLKTAVTEGSQALKTAVGHRGRLAAAFVVAAGTAAVVSTR